MATDLMAEVCLTVSRERRGQACLHHCWHQVLPLPLAISSPSLPIPDCNFHSICTWVSLGYLLRSFSVLFGIEHTAFYGTPSLMRCLLSQPSTENLPLPSLPNLQSPSERVRRSLLMQATAPAHLFQKRRVRRLGVELGGALAYHV